MDVEVRLADTYDSVCMSLLHRMLVECASYGIHATVKVHPQLGGENLHADSVSDLLLHHSGSSETDTNGSVIVLDDGSNSKMDGTAMLQVCIPGFPHTVVLDGDNPSAYDACIRHLADLGHRYIAFVSGDGSIFGNAGRSRDFLHAAHGYGQGINASLIRADHSLDAVANAVRPAIMNGITALVCSTDMLAISVMHEASSLGMHVPGDLSVVGYGDVPESAVETPGLTTVRLPFKRSAKAAVQIIREFDLSQNVDVERLIFRSEFIIRQSTSGARDKRGGLE